MLDRLLFSRTVFTRVPMKFSAYHQHYQHHNHHHHHYHRNRRREEKEKQTALLNPSCK